MKTNKQMITELLKTNSQLNLSVWEKDFINNIKNVKNLSGRQITKLYDIYNKVVKGY